MIMIKLTHFALMLCVALSLAACGGQQAAAPAPAPEAKTEAPTAPAAPVETAPAAEAPAAPAEAMPTEEAAAAPAIDGAVTPPADGAAAAGTNALVGTKWEFGDYKVNFKDDKTVHLNGGQLTLLTGGQGLDATYTLKDGELEVQVMGQTRKGTWDGTKLVFDNVDGTKVQ